MSFVPVAPILQYFTTSDFTIVYPGTSLNNHVAISSTYLTGHYQAGVVMLKLNYFDDCWWGLTVMPSQFLSLKTDYA